MDPGWVTIALLGKPRGNRGEVTAISLSDHPDRFATLRQVYLLRPSDPEPSPYTVEEIWDHQGTLIFKFEHIDSIDQASQLSGSEVRLPAADRLPLESGDFYQSDLIGCLVRHHATQQVVGTVTGFEAGGSSGLLQIGPTILIPFTRQICVLIDLPNKVILIDPPEGLLDLNQ